MLNEANVKTNVVFYRVPFEPSGPVMLYGGDSGGDKSII